QHAAVCDACSGRTRERAAEDPVEGAAANQSMSVEDRLERCCGFRSSSPASTGLVRNPQSAEPELTSPAVIGPLDPSHDRDAQLLACGPSLPVEDVLLEQRKERL